MHPRAIGSALLTGLVVLTAASCSSYKNERAKNVRAVTPNRVTSDAAEQLVSSVRAPASDPAPTPNGEMQAVLDAHAALGPKPIEKLSPVEARRQPSPVDAVVQILQDRGELAPEPKPALAKVATREVPGHGGARIAARVYTPNGTGPFPVVVYFHGGGWVIGSLDLYDASCRALADRARAVVVSIDYRQAPEHKFPTAHEDAYAALQHVLQNAADFDGDPARVAVAGESAGGNLATATCRMAKDRKGRMPVHQLLIYPVTDYAFDTASYLANAEARPLNRAMMKWFFGQYLNSPADGLNRLVSPLRSTTEELRGLPPATVITAEIDPLRSEGMAYAMKLEASQVSVNTREFQGVTHEFFGMGAVLEDALEAQEFAAERLVRAFRGERTALVLTHGMRGQSP